MRHSLSLAITISSTFR